MSKKLETENARAIHMLVEGKHGPDQPAYLRKRLKSLQGQGLLSYTADGGWVATPEGRELVGREGSS